jgi:hypothetical protein
MSETEERNLVSLEKEIQVMPKNALDLEIKSDEDLSIAAQQLKSIKTTRAKVNEYFDEMIERWHLGHKAELARKKQFSQPLDVAEKCIKEKMAVRQMQIENEQREAQRLLQEQADKAAAEEQLQKAIEAEEAGDVEVAESILNEPTTPALTLPVKKAFVPQGVSYRDNWKGRVTDPALLMKAIVKGFAPANLMAPDLSALNSLAKSSRGSLTVPGVVFYCEKIVAGSSK